MNFPPAIATKAKAVIGFLLALVTVVAVQLPGVASNDYWTWGVSALGVLATLFGIYKTPNAPPAQGDHAAPDTSPTVASNGIRYI